jgi:hypothetical protein
MDSLLQSTLRLEAPNLVVIYLIHDLDALISSLFSELWIMHVFMAILATWFIARLQIFFISLNIVYV